MYLRHLTVLSVSLAAFSLGCSGDSGGGRDTGAGGSAGKGGSAGTAGKAGSGGGGGTAGSGGTATGGTATGGGGTGTGGGGSSAGGSSGGSAPLPDVDWSTAPAAPVARTCVVTPGTAPAATWTNVTSNLKGHASECGNLTIVSADPCSDQVIAGIAK